MLNEKIVDTTSRRWQKCYVAWYSSWHVFESSRHFNLSG